MWVQGQRAATGRFIAGLAVCLSLCGLLGAAGVPAARAQVAKPVVASAASPVVPIAQKKPITHDVYDSWRSIVGQRLSRDGVWVAYSVQPQDGDGELIVRNLKTEQEYRHPRGTGDIITPDSKFVLFTISPTKAERDRLRQQRRPATGAPAAPGGAATGGPGGGAAA